ncbi:GNAT family N-acetyltransferase [Rhabdaerophilum sp. SD176]|uniref:GNAT family N-acetyltransferase n=1 Tax=Rhabdaerophilum sp. SD176 TaxID=2983548 RepID=UPI0024DF85FD|nr:GNAT family N-acetyltransferase [Rhabdaerophilum sp. SD176]
MNVPVIRPVQQEDLAAVRDVLVRTWHATYDEALGAAKVAEITSRWHSPEALQRQMEDMLAQPGQRAFLVAEADGRVIATASAHLAPEGWIEISRIYILPEFQRGGLGRRLLQKLLATFPAARHARLEVEPRNARALGFYRRHGFLPVSSGVACGGDAEAGIAHLVLEAALPLWTLRPARDEDAQDLFGLLALCFAEYPGCFVDPHEDLPDLVKPGHWLERTRPGPDGRPMPLGGAFLVLEDTRGRICASVAYDLPEPGIAELHRLYVRPDCRRQGIAARLVLHVEALARSDEARRMILWSDTRFTSAHGLYRRLGYEATGQTRDLGDISRTSEYQFTKML